MLESHVALKVVGKIILIINNHLKFYHYTKPASDSIANGAKCVLIKRVLITFPSFRNCARREVCQLPLSYSNLFQHCQSNIKFRLYTKEIYTPPISS